MSKRTLACSLWLPVCLAALAACQTSRPNTKNTLGTYTTSMKAAPDTIAKAAEGVLEELGLTPMTSSWTKIDGEIVAKTALGKSVTVRIDYQADELSKVSISGVGDEALSLRILDNIEKKL